MSPTLQCKEGKLRPREEAHAHLTLLGSLTSILHVPSIHPGRAPTAAEPPAPVPHRISTQPEELSVAVLTPPASLHGENVRLSISDDTPKVVQAGLVGAQEGWRPEFIFQEQAAAVVEWTPEA